MKETFKVYKRKEECCGCTACYAICPSNAINMKTDAEGFLYPFVNESICNKCYLCLKVCVWRDDVTF